MQRHTKRVNIKDVAARAGVSYQTVSKVLNGMAHVSADTAARVWAAARELGYQPHLYARNLRVQRSRMIGYSWVPPRPGYSNHILDLFLTSMVEEAEAVGYHVLPFPYREGDALVSGYRGLIDAGKVDGFVLTGVNYHDPRVQFLLERQFPFVSFGRSDPELAFPFVDVDGAAGLRQATEHLLAHRHRRIALLAWPDHSRVGNDRVQGYFDALHAAGLAADPELIARGEGTFEFSYAATCAWLARTPERRPTAVVALSDPMAIGAMHAVEACGLSVGQDVAVVGFDDVPMTQYLRPPLSSVRQPIREAGRACVELLVARLEGRPLAGEQILLTPTLIVRASSIASERIAPERMPYPTVG